MKKILVILLLIPCFIKAQYGYKTYNDKKSFWRVHVTDSLLADGVVRFSGIGATLAADTTNYKIGVLNSSGVIKKMNWPTAAQLGAVTTNIYTANGTLANTRTITMSGNTINFTGGNFGIGMTPTEILDVNGTMRASTSVKTPSLSAGANMPYSGFAIEAEGSSALIERLATTTDPALGTGGRVIIFNTWKNGSNNRGWRYGLNTGGIAGGYYASRDFTIDYTNESGQFKNVFRIQDSTGNIAIGGGSLGGAAPTPTSTLFVTGSFANYIQTKTTTYTAADDFTIVCNNVGAMTVNLPAASTCPGRIYVIKKISALSNDVTVDADASETIDGATTKVLTLQYESLMIQCNGTSWFIIASN